MNTLLTGAEARSKLLVGVNKLANAVKGTFGPQARTVIIQNPVGMPVILNDGVTIARAVHDNDPYVQMGIDLLKEVASEAQEKSGDGTTSAILIAQTLCNGSLSLMENGTSPLDIRDKLKNYLEQTEDYLRSIAIDDFNLEDVARIAANNDEELGIMIADVVINAGGKDGGITIEKSQTGETYVREASGLEINAGYTHSLMANSPRGKCEFDNALVLTTTEKIQTFSALVPVLEVAVKENRPLVIFCSDFNAIMLQNLLVNIVQGKVSVCMVKPAGMPEQQQAWLDDISSAVGSKLFKVSLNESIIEVKKTDLGACEKFISNQTTTTLVGVGNDPDHLDYLSEMYETVGNNWLEEQYQNRINRLTTGISTIYVGGASEVEQVERKERVDDAVNACKLALESGVVIGGGADLYRATNHIVPDDGDGPIFCLFCEALTNPIQTIVENSGQPERTYHFLKSNRDYICGKTGKVFSGSDILDPVDVVINSLESAVSIAALVLMTDAAIIAPEQ